MHESPQDLEQEEARIKAEAATVLTKPTTPFPIDATSNVRDALLRIRVVDPAWIDFNWRSGGPPLVRLARLETVRYVARNSYLSVKTEETLRFEDGRQRFTTRELVEMRAVPVADVPLDPFNLEIPAGTPIQRQSAYEQLSGVSTAFSRLPVFIKSLDSITHH